MSAQTAHQGRGQFDAGTGVVVACNHHDGQRGLLLVGADNKVIQALLRFDGRVYGIEDVPGNQECIRLLLSQLGQKPGQKAGVFEIAFLTM